MLAPRRRERHCLPPSFLAVIAASILHPPLRAIPRTQHTHIHTPRPPPPARRTTRVPLESGDAKRTQVLAPILASATRTLLLTGTPTTNGSAADYHSQLSMLSPGTEGGMPTAREWCARYCEVTARRRRAEHDVCVCVCVFEVTARRRRVERDVRVWARVCMCVRVCVCVCVRACVLCLSARGGGGAPPLGDDR